MNFETKLFFYVILIAIITGLIFVLLDWLDWKWTNKLKRWFEEIVSSAFRSINGV